MIIDELEQVKEMYYKVDAELQDVMRLQQTIAEAQEEIMLKLRRIKNRGVIYMPAHRTKSKKKYLAYGRGKCKYCGISVSGEFKELKAIDKPNLCKDCEARHETSE